MNYQDVKKTNLNFFANLFVRFEDEHHVVAQSKLSHLKRFEKMLELADFSGKSILDIDLRKMTGVTLLAIRRGSDIIEHPIPETVFMGDDIAYLLGDPEQINFASELLVQKPADL